MLIDPITAWHADASRYDHVLTRPATPELTMGELVPNVGEAAGKTRRTGHIARLWATRLRRTVPRRTHFRPSVPATMINNAIH